MSNVAAIAVGFFSFCFSPAAFILSSYAMLTCPGSLERSFEKISIGALFTIISFTVFGIHTSSAEFGESSSILAAYFLVGLLGLGLYSLSKVRNFNPLPKMTVFMSQLHTINLACQTVCFLILVNQL